MVSVQLSPIEQNLKGLWMATRISWTHAPRFCVVYLLQSTNGFHFLNIFEKVIAIFRHNLFVSKTSCCSRSDTRHVSHSFTNSFYCEKVILYLTSYNLIGCFVILIRLSTIFKYVLTYSLASTISAESVVPAELCLFVCLFWIEYNLFILKIFILHRKVQQVVSKTKVWHTLNFLRNDYTLRIFSINLFSIFLLC